MFLKKHLDKIPGAATAGIVYPGKHIAHHLHFVTEYKDNEPNTCI